MGRPKRKIRECIYCHTRDVLAGREHVLNDAFGRFQGALTLTDSVCTDCNRHFGETFDRTLARATPEGLERYLHGVRTADEIVHFRFDEVQLRHADIGDFKGAPFRLESRNSQLIAVLVPTVLLRDGESEEWTEFSEVEFARGDWKKKFPGKPRQVKVLAEGRDWDRVMQIIANQGLTIKNGREFALPVEQPLAANVEMTFSRSAAVDRAVAKIAFNYAASRCGAEYVLSPSFDAKALEQPGKLRSGRSEIMGGKMTVARVFADYLAYRTPRKTPGEQDQDRAG